MATSRADDSVLLQKFKIKGALGRTNRLPRSTDLCYRRIGLHKQEAVSLASKLGSLSWTWLSVALALLDSIRNFPG